MTTRYNIDNFMKRHLRYCLFCTACTIEQYSLSCHGEIRQTVLNSVQYCILCDI